MEILREISENLQSGDDGKIRELTRQAINQNIAPQKIIDNGLIAGMDIVGEKFKTREFFLPDVLLAAKAMSAGMEELQPLLSRETKTSLAKVVIGTVHGDLHDIGKNLVGIMLHGAGFEVIDLGNDVPPKKFIKAIRKEHATILGMSALLTTTMPAMQEVIDLLHHRNLKKSVKVIVGGAPVSQEFADQIGADAYAYDAANAIEKIKAFVKEMGDAGTID